MARPQRREDRRGFTLIELLIAIVILGTVGVGLARMMTIAARSSANSGAVSYRAAALNTEVSRVAALPPGTLSDGTTTRTVTTQPFPHTVTTTAVTASGVQTVTITVTPTGPRAIGARSRTLTRAAGGTGGNPFNP